jgi:hypothetical protein
VNLKQDESDQERRARARKEDVAQLASALALPLQYVHASLELCKLKTVSDEPFFASFP